METTSRELLEEMAETSGLSVAILDEHGDHLALSNNNSICGLLYESAEFRSECARFCGRALTMSQDAGKTTVEYRCHVGLVCRAKAVSQNGSNLVAIVGRAFTRAEDYRHVTERAIDGDLSQYPPEVLFENVLISGSEKSFDGIAEKLDHLAVSNIHSVSLPDPPAKLVGDDLLGISNIENVPSRDIRSEEILELGPPVLGRSVEIAAEDITEWRSLFGSLLNRTYSDACHSILDFVSRRYQVPSLLWLELRRDRFDPIASIGDLASSPVKIAIAPKEPRLQAAAKNECALELTEAVENSSTDRRSINLFPLSIAGEIQSVLGVAGAIDQNQTRNIVRFCRSIAPQIEILRLRNEVQQRDVVASALKKFNEDIKKTDGSNFWLRLTQISAQLLRAERASLLLLKDQSDTLQAMASVGIRADLAVDEHLGDRVARFALEKGSPLLVQDVGKVNIQAAPKDRRYRTPSFISYPIEIGDGGVAVLNLTDKVDGGSFGENDLELLNVITPQIAIAIDRTELKQQAGTYAQLSVTDPLTGLLNRRYLETRLSEEVSRSDRHRFPISFMMLDVDEFKTYNDKFGHPAGDEALKLVGQVINDMIRTEDVAARYGGEEFAILLPQATADEAETIAERLRQRIETAPFANRQVTVSIGIASCFATPSSSMDDLISAADQALYRAKQRGRNNVQSFGDIDSLSKNVH